MGNEEKVKYLEKIGSHYEDDLELLEDKILDRLKTITESKFLLSLGNYWGARRFLLY